MLHVTLGFKKILNGEGDYYWLDQKAHFQSFRYNLKELLRFFYL